MKGKALHFQHLQNKHLTGSKMNTLSQVLPVSIVTAMINSDCTGLTDQEDDQLIEYSNDLIKQGYNAIPCYPEKEAEFYTSNDFNNLGGDCLEVVFTKL